MKLTDVSHSLDANRSPIFCDHDGQRILIAYHHDNRGEHRDGWGYCRADLSGAVELIRHAEAPCRTPREAAQLLLIAHETPNVPACIAKLKQWQQENPPQ